MFSGLRSCKQHTEVFCARLAATRSRVASARWRLSRVITKVGLSFLFLLLSGMDVRQRHRCMEAVCCWPLVFCDLPPLRQVEAQRALPRHGSSFSLEASRLCPRLVQDVRVLGCRGVTCWLRTVTARIVRDLGKPCQLSSSQVSGQFHVQGCSKKWCPVFKHEESCFYLTQMGLVCFKHPGL